MRIFENPSYVDPDGETVSIRHEVDGLFVTTYVDDEIGGSFNCFDQKEIDSNITYWLKTGCTEKQCSSSTPKP